MKNNKNYKILVLSDLKNPAHTEFKSAVKLASIVNGELDFFHVKKATEIVKNDIPFTAVRTVKKAHVTTESEIKQLAKKFSNEYNVKISYDYAFGNVKNEIREYIEATEPDIIVIGKRKSRPFKIARNSITDMIIKNHHGDIMVAADESTFEPNKEFAMGVFNEIEESKTPEFFENLLAQSAKPLKSFEILKQPEVLKENDEPIENAAVKYVFEQSDNIIDTISKYLSKNNIDLLYLNKNKDNKNTRSDKEKVDIHKIITKMRTSLLISSNHKPVLN